MRLPAAVTDVLISALLAAAAIIAVTGGGRIRVAGAMVSAQGWSRPLVASCYLCAGAQEPGLARRRVGAGKVIRRFASLVTAALLAGALAFTAMYIIHACGGLDSHGYVAFSELLSRGRLSYPLPDLSWLAVDRPAEVASPLGFIPSLDSRSVVPEFPPGLPILLAAARMAAGPQAVFWVAWLCEIGLVLALFFMARARYGTVTASLAAVLMVAHPVAAAYSMQAMSDIPATLATTIAVYVMAGP